MSVPRLVEVYASESLNKTSDLTGDDQLKESARVYKAAVKSRKPRISLDSWAEPSGLPFIQTF